MTGNEIYENYVQLQNARKDSINIGTGLYSKKTKQIDSQIKELQAKCNHINDNGTTSFSLDGYCSLCGKKKVSEV